MNWIARKNHNVAILFFYSEEEQKVASALKLQSDENHTFSHTKEPQRFRLCGLEANQTPFADCKSMAPFVSLTLPFLRQKLFCQIL